VPGVTPPRARALAALPLAALPNVLSGMRIVLVLPFAWALLRQDHGLALWLFVVAALTDGLDGWLARRFGWQSQLGGLLDPAADKLLVAVSVSLFAWLDLVPVWVAAVVLGRDVVIVLGALYFRWRIGQVAWGASALGKASTAAQLLLILTVLVVAGPAWQWSGATHTLLELASLLLAWAVALLALASGLDYVRTWSLHAARRRRGTQP
jgi:cardiolipin synthase